MIARSLLLVLLVLVCFQSFTTAQNARGPDRCCFSYQTHRVPVKQITAYKVTEQQCTKPGVIFALKSGRRVCADSGEEWVKNCMEKIDQRLSQP